MKFSIVTVCFNSEKTIAQTIESILAQSCQEWEHIIIDGASRDGTQDIVRKYEPQYKGRLKFISEPDKGIYDAMNKGVKMASGEIVGILNSDDWYEPNALDEIALAAARSPGCDIYYGTVRLIAGDDQERSLERWSHLRLFNRTLFHPACFVSSATYRKFGLFDMQYRITADYDFLLRVRIGGGSFVPVDAILSNFRITGTSAKNLLRTELEEVKVRRNNKICTRRQAAVLIAKGIVKTAFHTAIAKFGYV